MPLTNKTRAYVKLNTDTKTRLDENKLILNPTLTEKQKEALRILTDHSNPVTNCVLGGGAGGGKSRLGCLWIIVNSLKYPHTRHLIGGKELKKLKQTTLKTLFEVLTSLKMQDQTNYRYSELRGEIRFNNGSEILIMDLADRPNDPQFEFLGSVEIMSAFLDEVGRLSEKAVQMVSTRIRHKLDAFCPCGFPTYSSKILETHPKTGVPTKWKCGNPNCRKETTGLSPKMLLTCNPSRGWLYNEYYKKWKDNKLEPHKAFIQSLASDNPYISEHYIKGLERQDPIIRDRLLLGSWEYQDSLNLFDLDKLAEMFETTPIPAGSEEIEDDGTTLDYDGISYEETDEYCMSIDVARLGDDKTCIMIWRDFDVIHYRELSKMKLNQQLNIIKKMQQTFQIRTSKIVLDTDGVGGGLQDFLEGSQSIINNSRPLDGENYQNLKTQLYFKLAEKINNGEIKIKVGRNRDSFKQRLIQELQVLKRLDGDWDGKIKMTSKDDVKKLISRSPDLSDAMAFRMYWAIQSSDFDYGFSIA